MAVKAQGGWTDYQLDVEFARHADEPRREGSDRRRAFETIRRSGTVPSPGTHRRRTYDLVERVDDHPNFAGTANIFRSSFWNLLKARVMGLPEAHAFTSDCMTRSKVHRPSGKLYTVISSSWERAKNPHIEEQHIYRSALKMITSQLPLDLDTLALVGGLFREAYLVCSLKIAEILEREFLELLEKYCAQPWLSTIGDELLQLAERRVLFWQMDKHFLGKGYYDDWPPMAIERPLFPLNSQMEELVAKEEDLFAQLAAAWAESLRQEQS